MPKVSFRMASASRESAFGVQTTTSRKIARSGHTEDRLTTAPSGCCVRKGSIFGADSWRLATAGALSRRGSGAGRRRLRLEETQMRVRMTRNRFACRLVPWAPEEGEVEAASDAQPHGIRKPRHIHAAHGWIG